MSSDWTTIKQHFLRAPPDKDTMLRMHNRYKYNVCKPNVKGKAKDASVGSVPVGVEGVSGLPFQGPTLSGRWSVRPSPPYLRSNLNPTCSVKKKRWNERKKLVTKLFVRVKLKARGERNRCIRRFDIESTWLVKSATHHQLYAALVWLHAAGTLKAISPPTSRCRSSRSNYTSRVRGYWVSKTRNSDGYVAEASQT